MTDPLRITSASNPWLVKLRRLVHDGAAYRKMGLLWLEGDHLCDAALSRGMAIEHALYSEAGWARPELRRLGQDAPRVGIVTDALWRSVSSLSTPAAMGFVVAAPASAEVEPGVATVVLDRLQDAGNVGSILRSAAALGARQVLALSGTAALWSPKVLRAAMGAHFGLRLAEGLSVEALDRLRVPLLATSSHAERTLGEGPLPRPAAWVFGHEGQGVGAAVLARCAATVRIPQPGGQESLNVAAAAAICLYESSRQ